MISAGSGTFYAAPRIKVGKRLFNGDTDNLYWVVGRLEGGNEWRGPFVSLALADAYGVSMLNKYVLPDLNMEVFVRVEIGKRYWLQDNRTWFLRTEKAYTQVRQLPADEPGPDPTPTVPVTTARFGMIQQPESYPRIGRRSVSYAASLGNYKTVNNQVWGYVAPDRNGLNGGYQIMPQSAIDLAGIYWMPSQTFGFDANTISAGNNCIVGPTILQDVYQYASKAAVRGSTTDDIQIIVNRPVTDIYDDDGSDGYYLAGYTVGWGSVTRFVRALMRSSSNALTEVPTVMDWNITTSGDLSLNQAVAFRGTNIFHFDSVESIKIAPLGPKNPSPNVCTYTGPSAGTVVPPGMIQLDDLVFPNMPFGLPAYVICNCSCYAVVDYIIRAAFVTRVDGVATYNYSDPLTARVCVFPFPVEPPITQCQNIVGPLFPTVDGCINSDLPNGNSGPIWRQIIRHDDYQGRISNPVYTVDDPPSAVVQCTWSDVPNQGGYTVLETWGSQYDVNTHKLKPDTDLTWWISRADIAGNYHVYQSWGRIVPPNLPGGPVNGGYNGPRGTVQVFAKVDPFGNGGSCPYPMPRLDAVSQFDLGLPSAQIAAYAAMVTGFESINNPSVPRQIQKGREICVDYYEPARLSFGPPPNIPRFRYWTGSAGIWIVDPGQQPPPYDNGSSAYLATMIDGRKAYWYLGDQGGQAQPGHGVIGWGYAFPGSGLTITYTRPYYASGPYRFYINSDTNTPVNPQSVRDYIPATGAVLDPTGSVGFITVPLAGSDPATGLPNFEIVYLYNVPQKKSLI